MVPPMSTAAEDVKALTIAVTEHMARADERDIAHMKRTSNLEKTMFGNGKAGIKSDMVAMQEVVKAVAKDVGTLKTWKRNTLIIAGVTGGGGGVAAVILKIVEVVT
jgi:hypothetical protein